MTTACESALLLPQPSPQILASCTSTLKWSKNFYYQIRWSDSPRALRLLINRVCGSNSQTDTDSSSGLRISYGVNLKFVLAPRLQPSTSSIAIDDITGLCALSTLMGVAEVEECTLRTLTTISTFSQVIRYFPFGVANKYQIL